MNSHRSPWITILILVAATTGILLAGWPEGSPRRAIRIAVSPWPGYEYLHLAAKCGFYDRVDAAVELVEFDSIADARRAFQLGQVDALTCTLVEAALLADRRKSAPRAVIFTDYSIGGDAVYVGQGVESIADLSGRRIAVESGSFDVVIVAAMLRTAGLTLDDVTIVKMPKTEMRAALADGLIDAVPTFPPYTREIEAVAGSRRIFDTSAAPDLVLSCVVFSSEVIAGRRAAVDGITDAFYRAVEWGEMNPAEANRIMGACEGVGAEEFGDGLRGVRMIHRSDLGRLLAPNGPVDSAFEFTAESLRKLGILSSNLAGSPPIERSIGLGVGAR